MRIFLHSQIVDLFVKLLSPREEDDIEQDLTTDTRETVERHDEQ